MSLSSNENVVALHGFVIRTHNIERVLVTPGDEPDTSEIVQVHSVTPPGKPHEVLYQSENHGDAVHVAKLLQVADDTVSRSQDPSKVISATVRAMNTAAFGDKLSETETEVEPETESEAPE